jgi:hypothetical protein
LTRFTSGYLHSRVERSRVGRQGRVGWLSGVCGKFLRAGFFRQPFRYFDLGNTTERDGATVLSIFVRAVSTLSIALHPSSQVQIQCGNKVCRFTMGVVLLKH